MPQFRETKSSIPLMDRNTVAPVMVSSRAPFRSVRLLDQLVEQIHYLHYSGRTERAYLFWARRFIRFHHLRHPREMGAVEVQEFLAHLAVDRKVEIGRASCRERV